MKKILSLMLMVAATSFGGVLWDGTNTTGRVETGFDDGTDTYGYWYEYTDADNKGLSNWTYPDGVVKDEYDNFFGPLTVAAGGIKGTANLNDGYAYPFVGFGFNISGEAKEAVDITCWGGLIIDYETTIGVDVEIGIVDEGTVTEYNNYTAKLLAGSGPKTLAWSSFKQAPGWGVTIPQTTALSTANAIKFKVSGDAGTTGDVFIKSVASISDCAPVTGIVSNKIIDNSFNYSNKIITLNSVQPISVYDVNGNRVMYTIGKSINLSTLTNGLYIVKTNSIHKIIIE